jgi:hypothetical protein
MITLDKGDSQIVLYCKGWFQKDNQVEDLRLLVGNRADVEKQYVGNKTILEVLLGVAKRVCPEALNGELIQRIVFGDWLMKANLPVFERALQALVDILAKVKVREIGNPPEILLQLADPDYTILPPSPDAKKRLEREATATLK